MEQQIVTTLRVTGNDFRTKLDDIKRILGLKSDAETVRVAVTWFWRKLKGNNGFEEVFVDGAR